MPELSDEELGIPEGLDPHIREELRKSRLLSRDLEAERAANATAQRELAFARAGIPDTPLAKAVAKTYDGENDPAAIKAYFEELGVSVDAPAADQNPPPPDPPDPDLAAHRRVAQLGADGSTDGSVRLEDAMNSAKNESELMAIIEAAPDTAVDSAGRRITTVSID